MNSCNDLLVTATARNPKASFGIIRWDAWTTHDGVEKSVVSQVERSLSPARFHERAPFFADVTEDGRIIVTEYTMETFDIEMEYAISAHVDYFAYVWYKDVMGTARKFHTQSKYRNDVKMCVCFDVNAIGRDFARKEMETLFLEDYYMKVLGGRPLMYYFGDECRLDVIADDIVYYRALTEKLGIPEPYAVIMNLSPAQVKGTNADAVSGYTVGGRDNEPFAAVMARADSLWRDWHSSGMSYIPTVSLGWCPEPRFINPVSWINVPENLWAQLPKADEIYEHFLYAQSYMAHPSVKELGEANTFLAYAWNEHDEGGWLCPTIAVDENGNQLYNPDGSKKINTERIEAVKRAIEDFQKGERRNIEFL